MGKFHIKTCIKINIFNLSKKIYILLQKYFYVYKLMVATRHMQLPLFTKRVVSTKLVKKIVARLL